MGSMIFTEFEGQRFLVQMAECNCWERLGSWEKVLVVYFVMVSFVWVFGGGFACDKIVRSYSSGRFLSPRARLMYFGERPASGLP